MRTKFDLKFWIGIAVSLFFMVLLFNKIDFRLLGAALRSADYRYVFLAVCSTFFSYFLRALRWRYLLIPEKLIPLTSLYPATIIGYMANNLLPARLGEVVRAYTLAHQEQLETPAVFASLVIDRLFDGFTVLLLLLVTLFTIQFPAGMEDAALALRAGGTFMFLFYGGVIIFLYLLKRQTMRTLSIVGYVMKPFPARVSDKLIPLLGSFIGGIRLSQRLGHIAALVATSAAIWLFCLLSVDLTLLSFNIHLPITAAMFILILLAITVMVPAAPGFIGTYHYACYKALSVFGVAKTASVSIALVMHGTGFFPVIIVGLYYLWKYKISFKELQGVEKVR
ncbi:MAG: lysylphosphatidylglycerol synthase transmembrane domain-containing protein [Desulfuromonadaceae bacterium]|nr:lysylphosphatidylglycerol synthase transmembrane domain-containing protein [Desulfuromonadaceae bacterium]